MNETISLNFVGSTSELEADLIIYSLCEPTYSDDYGIVTDNAAGTKSLMLLNTCSSLYQQQTGSYGPMFLHELGHVL